MTIFGLLYASMSTLPRAEEKAAMRAIVAVSQTRNAALGVTGCLILGAGRFAQALEGEQSSVEEIMRSILRDPRHRQVTVLEQGDLPARRFTGWALGYAGPSLFVQRTIARPVSEALRGLPNGISELMRIMIAFRSADVWVAPGEPD